MESQDLSRLSRLTALVTLLQSKRLITATELAKKFHISTRTVYRDIRALEQAGIPICTEDGKGYSLVEGFHLPPVMFSEVEANALITAEQFILKNKDASLIQNYQNALTKVKAVLRSTIKEKAELLSGRIVVRQNTNRDITSSHLSNLQLAITGCQLIEIVYKTLYQNEYSIRTVEPLAVYTTQENWILIAWCRLRDDYRSFRLDNIHRLTLLGDHYERRSFNLQEYFEACKNAAAKCS